MNERLAASHRLTAFFGALIAVPRRFPISLLAAAAATFAAIVATEANGRSSSWDDRLFFCALLAFPLGVAASLWGETRGHRIVASLVAVLIPVGAWFLFPGLPYRESETTAMILLILAATALASAVPAMCAGSDGWWRTNLSTLNAAVLASIFALAVLIGLQLAIFSLDQLFGLEMPSAAARVFLFCGCFIGPAAMLAGIPRIDAADGAFAPWRLLSKFALVPLGLLYSGILIAYAVKMIVEQRLPDGMVAWPVLALGAYGTAAMLIAWPWTRTEMWARVFGRIYPPAFLAASVLLFIALATRIAGEGVTAERYLGLAAGVWFVIAALSFLIIPSRAPLAVPLTFAITALISAVGPFSAAAIARSSQSARLTEALAGDWKGNSSAEEEIASRVRYLARQYGPAAVEPFSGPIPADRNDGWAIGTAALEQLGHPVGRENRDFRAWRSSEPFESDGFLRLHAPDGGNDRTELGKSSSGMILSIELRGRHLEAFVGGEQIHRFSMPTAPQSDGGQPVTLDWTFEGRNFQIVIFSFSMRDDEIGDITFSVIER